MLFNKQGQVNKRFLKNFDLNTIFRDQSEKNECQVESLKAIKAQIVIINKAHHEILALLKTQNRIIQEIKDGREN